MSKILFAPNSWSRVFARVCAVVLVFAALSPVSAEVQSVRDGARRAGHAVGSVAHDIGQGAKEAGKDIGGAAKEGGKEFRRAVKGG